MFSKIFSSEMRSLKQNSGNDIISYEYNVNGLNGYSYCSGNPVMFIDPLGLSTTPPGDMDWNGDGIVDTKRDRQRFDSNNNNQADWIEDGYDNATDWYADKTYNVLENFPHVYQTWKYNLCWAADTSMVIEWFTDVKIDFVQIARMENGTDFNRGRTSFDMVKILQNQELLNNSQYRVKARRLNMNKNSLITPGFIKNEIDNGRPMILCIENNNESQGHVLVIVGYDYSDSYNMKVICHDSATNAPYSYVEEVAGIINPERPQTIIAFERIG